MWDGVRREVRRDVDIVVEGHRIRAVEPHAEGRAGKHIDARDRLVMPGLVDMHHHREMQGYAYGDRQGRLWLSLGVTTTRSPGRPAYHMVEEREGTRSGARIAPRYAPIDHAAVSLHMNLRAMVTYGFTPYEALTTATSLAGETLHEDLGRIAPGMYADLAVVDGEPLTDIKDAANVEQVLVSGIAHTVDSLTRPFVEPPAVGFPKPTPGSTVLPPVPEHPANDAFWWHGHAYVEEARHACCSG